MHTVTKAYVNVRAIKHNLSQIRLLVGESVEIMPVVKANAYGHGLTGFCKALSEEGMETFGVATIDEGMIVRDLLPDARVVLLGGSLPDQAEAIVASGLIPVVFDIDQAYALDREAGRAGKSIPIHVKVDTGMSRLGIRYDNSLAFLSRIATLTNLGVVGLMTHLATADAQDSSFTMQQLDRFDSFIASSGLSGQVTTHAANSAALMKYIRSHYDMVRPGLMLYGISPTGATPPGITLEPALKLTSRIVRLARLRPGESVGYGRTFVASREMNVATVPIGYGDGYDYNLFGQAEVLIRGMRRAVIGSISMDMIGVAIDEPTDVSVGDEVVIVGEQDGQSITVNELAFLAHTISWEILCGLSERIDRIYIEQPLDD